MSEEIKKNNTLKDDELDAVAGGATDPVEELKQQIERMTEEIKKHLRQISEAVERVQDQQQEVKDENK